MDIKQLRSTVDELFNKRSTLNARWQELAEHFYPERADFTVIRDIGNGFADNLMNSYPIQCRRDLGDQIGHMLRPTEVEWGYMAVSDEGRNNNDSKRWLEMGTKTMRRAMYDRKSLFARASKQGDHDYAAFGQDVIQVTQNRTKNGLLYRCHHLRDMVWMENEDGELCLIARKWKPYNQDLKAIFRDKCHSQVGQDMLKKPFDRVDCYHIICMRDMYDGRSESLDHKKADRPYWSIYYDIKHDHVMEEITQFNREYAVSRWQTVSGSQYAYSPATIVALPDARLIQAMTYTLLEAGEKATTPPLIATKDVIRSDVEVFAGGITWISEEYDEKMGEALRPLSQDYRGLPFGLDMQQDIRSMLHSAFFLNKLTLPERGKEATAYEISQRVQEYIRGALPIFEPMEQEKNGQIMDLTFDIMFRAGAFGSPFDMPDSLQGADIEFKFRSPLHDAIEQQKGNKFLEMQNILGNAAQLDPDVLALPNYSKTLRDVLGGIQVPAGWLNSEDEVEAKLEEQAQLKQMAQAIAGLEQGGKGVASLAKANRDIAEAEPVAA